jgi:transcriptional regulator with XRE-family HTH domain
MNLLARVRAEQALPQAKVRRSIREAAGVSQRAVAEELGVSAMTVSRWEDGSRTPRGELAERYGRLLGELREVALGGRSVE